MKYVGANNAFIRIPFVVEGIALGLFIHILQISNQKYTYMLTKKGKNYKISV